MAMGGGIRTRTAFPMRPELLETIFHGGDPRLGFLVGRQSVEGAVEGVLVSAGDVVFEEVDLSGMVSEMER